MNGIRLFLVLLLFFPISAIAQESTPEPSSGKAKGTASLEIGVESAERRFVRPRLRFDFPLKSGLLFTSIDYYHRTNGDLEGEVDFWLTLGYNNRVSDDLELEFVLNHFCRHKTLRDYPDILDINELFARFWLSQEAIRLGFGGGTYLGQSNNYESLLLFNFVWPRIFDSEFSASVDIKLVDFQEIFYELELAIALDPSADLFARYTKQYEYPKTAYLGIRFNSRGGAGEHVDELRFRGGLFPDDDDHKVFSETEFKLAFFRKPRSRLLLSLSGYIPVERGKKFLGAFYPEKIRYLAALDYEKKITTGLFAFGYFQYNLHLPVDVDQSFTSSLGLGLGLKNQSYFKKLEKNFRFVVFGGQNFSRRYDFGLRVGLNTTGKSVNFGGDVRIDLNGNEFYRLYEFFAEFGSEVKVRPFLAFEQTTFRKDDTSRNRLLLGLELYAWR